MENINEQIKYHTKALNAYTKAKEFSMANYHFNERNNLISKKLSKSFNIEEMINTEFINIFSDSIKGKFIYSFEEDTSSKYIFSDPISKIPIAIATKNSVNYISDLSSLNNIPT